MWRRAALLGAVILILITFFFIGFNLGLFLFKERRITQIDTQTNTENNKTQTNAEINKAQTNADDTQTNAEINQAQTNAEKIPPGSALSEKPKLTEWRGLEVNLTNNKAFFYEDGKLIKTFPLLYQSPENKWYQAPTGYFRAGAKHEKHLSSLFPVMMPYAIQFYEDFFIHGIPYYLNGEAVSSRFTGGCLRFDNDIAKEIYDLLKTGDQIVVYKTFDDLEIKKEFYPPVEIENFWIRQRFNNPYRVFWRYSGTSNLKLDYYQHTGVDFAPIINNQQPTTYNPQQSVYVIYDGKIAKIQLNDGNDHGLGNTVIIEHLINGKKIYSLYAHLDSIKSELKEGDIIKKGEIIGRVGNSGYGCQNYWRVGEDGCQSQAPHDIHLHFEIKKAAVLENPEGKGIYYGYTPDYPQKYGYFDPVEFLFGK
jgi:murein DD-endopeptidase MepM/ murein hydrolase activator NlpD